MEIFKNIKNLKGNEAYSGVRVVNDYTKKEREQEAALRREAKNLEATGRGQHRVTGPPWRRGITKVSETAQERNPRPRPMGSQEQKQDEHRSTREEVQEAVGQMVRVNQEGPVPLGPVE